MRIAMLITELEPGGAERAFTNLALGLTRRGHDVTVAALGARPVRPAFTDALEQAGIPIECLGFQHAWQFPLAVWRVRDWLKSQPIDIAQSFLFHANVVAAAALFGAGIPLVTGLRVAEPARWRHCLEGKSSASAAAVVCVSRGVRRHAVRDLGVPRRKLRVIPNGLDLSDPRWRPPQASTPQAERRAWLILGRLTPQKGLDWILPRLPELLADFPDRTVQIVGDGPLRSSIDATIRSRGLTERVELRPWTADPERVLANCEFLLMPSRWEGMPNVLLEAMALGRPVVAARVEGVRELLGPAAADQTFEFGHLDGLRRVIQTHVAQPERAAVLGAANRQRVEQTFNLESMIRRYEALYAELLCRSDDA